VCSKLSGNVSVVMPCLNEVGSVGICIRKIREIMPNAEIIVADNGSTDGSAGVAYSYGAKVVLEKRRGYGSAYMAGIKAAQGEYIVIMDCDNTYDFGMIPQFVGYLATGFDFVIGNRFGGDTISMPWKSRYIGNPILSGMFRLLFHTKINDIHCGMRAFTKEAYNKMNLKTLGKEFASEMVASAIKNKLKIAEVPINYYPRVGKSKLHPIRDALRHIRWMLWWKMKGG
jgi:glycosyltransferase involved in cell wall biosynthesis